MNLHLIENVRDYLCRKNIAQDKGSPLRETAARNRNRIRNDHES